MAKLPKIPADMLKDLRLVVMSEHIGGAAPTNYRQHQRFKALQRRKLIKYFDRKHARWDLTFYLATGYGHAEVAATCRPGIASNPVVGGMTEPQAERLLADLRGGR